MNRAAFKSFALALVFLAASGGASLTRAQIVALKGQPYPNTASCLDATEAGLIDPNCSPRGLNDITLYPRNPRLTAEDLCNLAGPDAMYVRQRSSGDVWTYICPGAPAILGSPSQPGDCAAPTGSSFNPPPQSGCSSSCFCVDCYEGVEVRMVADHTIDFGGQPAACSASLAIAGTGPIGNWLVSTPGNFPTYQDLANATCLTSTGLGNRGTIEFHDPVTYTGTTVTAGTSAAQFPLPASLRAFTLRNPQTPICYNSPGTQLNPVVSQSTNSYCIVGLGNGSNYAWWIDLGGDNDPTQPTAPGDPFETNVGPTGINETAVNLAGDFVTSIMASPHSAPTGTTATHPTGSNCFTITNSNNTGFNLWVAAPGSGTPLVSPCAVTSSGCTYNPTITLVPSPLKPVPAMGRVGGVILIAAFLLAVTVLVRRRSGIAAASRAAG